MKLDHNMKVTQFERTDTRLEPISPPSLAASTNLVAIEKHTNIFDRWRADRAASRQAGYSLAELKTAGIQAEHRIANTALKIAEVKIRCALVSGSLLQIGALTVDLNQKTAAVEERLTTGSHAEVIAHLENRAASVCSFKALEGEGRISSEEATVLASFAQVDAVDDINRSRERTRKAKEALGALHGFALDGIARAKDSVS
jgi:hypothetical protein